MQWYKSVERSAERCGTNVLMRAKVPKYILECEDFCWENYGKGPGKAGCQMNR
jgi:hypothetical protein